MNTLHSEVRRSLSDEEVKRLIPDVKVMKYEDIPNGSLPLPMVILYETALNRGHWVLLHETPEGIEFFDSYGYTPDAELKMVNPQFRKVSGQLRPKILRMLRSLADQGYKINYNQYDFQKEVPEIATCGRWCVVRYWFSNCTIATFAKAIKAVIKATGLSGDEIVTMLT